MSRKRFISIFCSYGALLAVLAFLAILSASDTRSASARRSQDPPAATNTPTNTPTQLPTSMPNLWPGISWSADCAPRIVHLITYSNSIPTYRCISPTVMRFANNNGDYIDIPVPGLCQTVYESYTYDCAVGTCIPDSWLASPPFTLTVDYYNYVPEYNESDNITHSVAPPPCSTSTPIPTETATWTNTPTFTYTPTRTATQPVPSPTTTGTGNCLITVTSAQTVCDAPSTFAYTFQLHSPCGPPQAGTVYFDVAPDIAGPWTTYDQHPGNAGYTVQGSFNENNIPAQYNWYRIRLYGPGPPPLPAYQGQTAPAYICSREPLCPASWNLKADYPRAARDQALTSDGTTLYSFGGRDASNHVLSDAYAYDTTTDTWRTLPPLPQPRFWASAIVVNGLVYVMNGGDATFNATDTVFIYDPVANTWSVGPDSTIPTYGQAIVNLNGQIYRIGGGYGSDVVYYVSSVYVYGQGFVAPLPEGRAFSAALALGGYIYLAGGDTDAGINTATYRYDPVANIWEDAPIANMFTARSWDVSGFVNGRWLLAGGAFDDATSVVGWDPQTNSWSSLTPLRQPAYNAGGTAADGALYVVGGFNEQGFSTANQQYDPSGCPMPTSTATTATATPTLTLTFTPTSTSTHPSSSTMVVSSATATKTPTLTPTPTVTATSTLCALTFSDVLQGSTFYTYIRCLACVGIVSGYQDGTFRPYNNVTRGQIAKIVSNAAGFSDIIPPDRQTFEDISPGSTFWMWIERMHSDTGLMEGYQCGGPGEPCVPPGNRNYFRPYNNAVRGQIMKVAVGTAIQVLGWTTYNPQENSFEDVAFNTAFYIYIETAYAHGVVSGYPCGGPGEPCGPGHKPYFRTLNNATRGQTAKIITNTFFPGCAPPERRR